MPRAVQGSNQDLADYSVRLGHPETNIKPIKRFRDDHNHLPGDSDIRQARNKNAVNINGAEHMEMIVQHMENVGYDKFHKPNPDGQLEVSVNMFIDTIQGKNLEI